MARTSKSPIKFLSEEQTDAFFGVIASVRDRAIFRILLHRGLRASEIGTLQLSDWRVKDQRLYVHRKKGSRSGEYKLLPIEKRAFMAWLKVRGDRPGPIFPSARGSRLDPKTHAEVGISQQMLDVLVKQYGAAAGLPRELCHCHAFKHSCGTHLSGRGETAQAIQDWMGHENIQNTMKYLQVTSPARDAAAVRQAEWGGRDR